jgi:predicted phosphodiesterase
MAVFNVVHLTDLHFGEVPNQTNIFSHKVRRKLASIRTGAWRMPASHNPHRAGRAAALLYEETERLETAGDQLDALVLSGDLATTGLQEDLEAAFRYVDVPPASTYFRAPALGERRDSPHLATIAELAEKCILVPGNHDRFQNDKCEAGGKLFDTIFKKYWASNTDGVVATIIPKPFSGPGPPPADGLERLAIIGADGCLRDVADASFKWMQMSQGYVYDDTEKALIAKTEEARRKFPDIVVIWVIHFPPHVTVPLYEVLRNYHLIERASRRLGVAVILSGHTHDNRVYDAGSGSAIWNGGSATQYAEGKGNWIQILQIEVTNNRFVRASRQNYKWKIEHSVLDFFLDSENSLP